MPLAIVCGLPSSGKTKFCIALRDYIERNHPEYPTSYNNPAEEKKSRAGFMSAVERSVSKNCIVIADGLNYIKGYRYQLYCVARAASTPHCAIHILNSTETCRRYNEGREDRYPSSVLEELLDRFEEPNNQTKWDSPLFSLMPDDDQAFAEICKTLCTIKTARPPSMATSTKTGANGDFVSALDRVTQEILNNLQSQMKPFGPSEIQLGSETLSLSRPLPQGQLAAIRRQFIHMNRLHPLDIEKIPSLFICYIKSTLQ